MKLLTVRRIWDKSPHNAFTDLVRFGEKWWCVFREAQTHLSYDGSLRVLASEDGEQWYPAALISLKSADLRDAKIVVTPDRRLMLSGYAVWPQPAGKLPRSMVWFSDEGKTWSQPLAVGDPNVWLWRPTWHRNMAYCVGYSASEDKFIKLYNSKDAKHYNIIVENLYNTGYPNEASLVFFKDNSCLCLLRRDPDPALMGRATPPYVDWSWTDLGHRLGGPHVIRLPDGRILAAARLVENEIRTALCWLDIENGVLEECLSLPSGGDTGYPGLAWHNGMLWVSYYSTHEEKTAVYLARVLP